MALYQNPEFQEDQRSSKFRSKKKIKNDSGTPVDFFGARK